MKQIDRDHGQGSGTENELNYAGDFNKRYKANEKFFSSVIDLIPPNVYLNPDDRLNWIKMVKNGESKKRKRESSETFEEALDGEEESENESGVDFKINKFDPKFFKTVSQILKDLEDIHQQEKKRPKLFKRNTQPLKNNTIKLQNKAQNKSSKNSGDENGKDQQNKKAKRASKFKEAKQAALKRIRQRYDSQTEPQIINLNTNQEASTGDKPKKPILNKNGQVVYSKFDFTADKTLKSAGKHKDSSKITPANVKPKDYKSLLKKLNQKKEKIEELKKVEPAKAIELEMKDKWRSAIDKAAGLKVKDDPELLAKTIKRIEKKKEKSKKGWEERTKSVEARVQQQQEKRRKNLEKRKEKNKEKKIKKLKKKGRILMGF